MACPYALGTITSSVAVRTVAASTSDPSADPNSLNSRLVVAAGGGGSGGEGHTGGAAGSGSFGEPFRQIYSLLIVLLQSISRRIGSLFQNGDLRNYLLYIFLFFVIVIIALAGVIR